MDRDKLPYEGLERMIAEAKKAVPPGSRWRHYKGGRYEVSGFAITEATQEVAVIYTPLEHPAVSFSRPLSVWQETVEWNGQTLPRFKQL